MSKEIKKKKKSKGFTLIEILVAVLIVGILTAVAVPSYQKAVKKSKTTAPLSNLGAIAKAQKAKKLESLHYTDKVEELDISLPDEATGEKATGSTFEGKDFTYTVYGDDEAAATATRKVTDPDDEYELSVDYGTGELFCRPAEHKICKELGLAEGSDHENNEEDDGDWDDCSNNISALASLVGMEGYEDTLREELSQIPYCQVKSNQYKVCFPDGGDFFCETGKISRSGCMVSQYCLANSSNECQGEIQYESYCEDRRTDLGDNVYLSKSCAEIDEETLDCNRWQNDTLYWSSDDGWSNWSCEGEGIAADGKSCAYYKDYRITQFVNGQQQDLINCGRWHHGDGVIIDECEIREYDANGNQTLSASCYGPNYSDRYDGAPPGSFNSNFTGCDSYGYYSKYGDYPWINCYHGTCQITDEHGSYSCPANAKGDGCA